MPPRFPARAALRTATATDHDAVDGIFSTADLSHRDGYRRFLAAQAGAHLPVEAALARDGVGAVVADWPARERAALLRDDLTGLGEAPPPPAGAIGFAGAPELLGGLYVLEGSRLGGQVLKRAVAVDLPRRFLSAADPAAWRSLLQVLDARLTDAKDVAAAVAAARRVFALFVASGQRWLEAE